MTRYVAIIALAVLVLSTALVGGVGSAAQTPLGGVTMLHGGGVTMTFTHADLDMLAMKLSKLTGVSTHKLMHLLAGAEKVEVKIERKADDGVFERKIELKIERAGDLDIEREIKIERKVDRDDLRVERKIELKIERNVDVEDFDVEREVKIERKVDRDDLRVERKVELKVEREFEFED